MEIPQHIGSVDIVPLIPYVAIVCVLGFVLLIMPLLTWVERVFLSLVQDRLGPNRVGPRGLLQPIADGVKLFFKEDILPERVDKFLYYLAPVLSMTPVLVIGAVVPFGLITVRTAHGPVNIALMVGHVNMGVLFILAATSLQVYGVVFAGWSSNSKYSLLGALRSSAQMVSYELSMGLTVLAAVFFAGSLDLAQMVQQQQGYWLGFLPKWNVFQFYGLGFIAAVIYLIAMVAEANRGPFDLPEGDTEIVGGYHTEYSSMKFATFYMVEYAGMLVASCVAVVIWFGGWHAPLPFLACIPGIVWYLVKVAVLVFVLLWIRATLPRLRYDALMSLGWKKMLPLALVVLLAVACVDFVRTPNTPLQPTVGGPMASTSVSTAIGGTRRGAP